VAFGSARDTRNGFKDEDEDEDGHGIGVREDAISFEQVFRLFKYLSVTR
jgi:hypothetical protein